MVVLTKEGTKRALRGKARQPKNMYEDEWNDIDERALSEIKLVLSANVFQEIVKENTVARAWMKLENKCLTLLHYECQKVLH